MKWQITEKIIIEEEDLDLICRFKNFIDTIEAQSTGTGELVGITSHIRSLIWKLEDKYFIKDFLYEDTLERKGKENED